jgi:4-hydroxy-tetrahydrodipicolinate synthase
MASPNPADALTGFIADLPTPFDKDDALDLAAFARLCERQIVAGATAILVGETTGEMATLTPHEHDAVVRAAVKAARGRVAVIAGAGSNATAQAIELTRRAEAAGADAVMSVVPYYNKPTQEGIEAHFRAIAASTRLPIVLHDTPARTVRGLSDETLIRLAQAACFVGLVDGSGDIMRPLRLRTILPPAFRLLCGDDIGALGYLLHGGDGCVSVTANVMPQLCRGMFSACRQGQVLYATTILDRLAPLNAVLSKDVTPASLKYALSLHGLMLPRVRLPMVEPDETAKAKVLTAIDGIRTSLNLCQPIRRAR